MIRSEIIDQFRVPPHSKVRLKDHDTSWAQTPELQQAGKDAIRQRALEILEKNLEELAATQELL